MPYERRLIIAKSAVTILLLAIMAQSWGGWNAPKESAIYALTLFTGLILCVGIILLWHPLHGTGRSVRITGVLATGVLAIRFLSIGADGFTLALFWGVVLATVASVNRKGKPGAGMLE